jgi:malonate decarboxylase delta subunit
MENLTFEFEGGVKPLQAGASYVVVGVVASSNLEVLAERKDLGGKCRFEVATTAANFSETWKAVFIDFMDRSKPRDVLFSINDFSAIPPVVSLRLDQALEQLTRSYHP